MTNNTTHEAYEVTDQQSAQETHIIRITSGTFEGSEHSYGTIKFDPENHIDENGNAKLTFDVEVHKAVVGGKEGVLTPAELEEDPAFQKVVGDILVSVILDFANEEENQSSESE